MHGHRPRPSFGIKLSEKSHLLKSCQWKSTLYKDLFGFKASLAVFKQEHVQFQSILN